MFHGRISLNVVLFLLLLNFVSWIRLELMHISLIVNIMSSLIRLHGFHFCLHLQTKSASKEKFRQDSNHCKIVLEATKLAYASKTRIWYFPETWLLRLLLNFPTRTFLFHTSRLLNYNFRKCSTQDIFKSRR